MQLPQTLQRFSEPTLLVVTDTLTAHCWLAGGDRLESIDGVSEPRTDTSEGNGAAAGSGDRVIDLDTDVHDTPRKERFAKNIAAHITSLVHDGHASRVCLASPPEMLHLVMAHLPEDVSARVRSRVEKNILHAPVLEAAALFVSAPSE